MVTHRLGVARTANGACSTRGTSKARPKFGRRPARASTCQGVPSASTRRWRSPSGHREANESLAREGRGAATNAAPAILDFSTFEPEGLRGLSVWRSFAMEAIAERDQPPSGSPDVEVAPSFGSIWEQVAGPDRGCRLMPDGKVTPQQPSML